MEELLFLGHFKTQEDILAYNDEHGHLPLKDWPPNNVCCRKIYWQMTSLFINEGFLGKGVCKELPKCVMCGCRESFPPPMFTGFMEN
jgi:hypothetical protein